MLYRIYRYRNIITGQSYIGQTSKNVNDRARKGKGYNKCPKFREAIDEYGWENFEQSILRLCTSQEEADQYEQYYIEKFNTVFPNGYNLYSGGHHYLCHNDVRQKISDSRKGEKNPLYGQHLTEETKKKMADSHKNFHHREDSKKKISLSRMGMQFSKTHRENISKSHKGIYWWTDGTNNIRSRTNPGDGWIRGRTI